MASPSEERFPKPEPGVDEIVRAQLEAEAGRVDAAGMWNGVLTRLEAEGQPAPQRKSFTRRIGVFAAVAGLAAAILVAVFFLDSPREAMATPAQVVEQARTAHARGGDRCYSQNVHVSGALPGRFPLLFDGERNVTVCARGNRFVVEPGFGGRGAWGCDETGRVWVAPSRDAAARFEESELPPAVRDAVKIRGLEFDTLLDDVLKDFDLTWSEPPSAANFSIKATRRGQAGHSQLASAELEIEKNTKLVKSLVLHRKLGPDITATITFTFMGETEKDTAAYTAEGHVDRADHVYDHTRLLLRGQVIGKLLKDRVVGNP